ncbi:MAG TPA: DUF177 domain-containing protein [Anaerolineales bacterium]|nr:DUF177 domain-containing protein [Anaerolineae bacterium]HIQ01450.1 DUF177 domain-containing protein [Anaerolineales bacterium]
MLQFDLSPLIGARPGKRLTFSLDEGPQWLDDIRVAFLRGRMQFTRVQGGILVEGRIEAQVEVECIRCLAHFPYSTLLEVEEVVGLAGRSRAGITYRLTEEGWFDPSSLLREQAWVALPMKPLCRPGCQGICPECGANLNLESCRCGEERVDPRLAVLARLLEDRAGS